MRLLALSLLVFAFACSDPVASDDDTTDMAGSDRPMDGTDLGTGDGRDLGTGAADFGPGAVAALAPGRVAMRTQGSCGILAGALEGSVRCWGDSALADRAPTEAGFVHVGGRTTVCAVTAAGTGECWNASERAPIPAAVTPAVRVDSAGDTVCVLSALGELGCFEGLFATPHDPGLATDSVIDFAMTDGHVCVVRPGGTVECAGRTDDGHGAPPADLSGVTEIAVSRTGACALAEGSLRCWGDTPATPGLSDGDLIHMDLNRWLCVVHAGGRIECWDGTDAVEIPDGLPSAARVAVGYSAYRLRVPVCVEGMDGAVHCFGYNYFGEASAPADVGEIATIETDYQFTLAVAEDGTATGMGEPERALPDDLGPVANASIARQYGCALTLAGAVRCWGRELSLAADEIEPPDSLPTASGVYVGGGVACVIRSSDGGLTCWGRALSRDPAPTSITGFTKLFMGSHHHCGLRDEGRVTCWGYPASSGLAAPSSLRAVDVAVGVAHTCAVDTSGALSCWGRNDDGQMDVPSDLGTVVDVAVNDNGVCALGADGRIRCWGDVRTSILDGVERLERLGPTAISMAEDVLCALTARRSAVCVGVDPGALASHAP